MSDLHSYILDLSKIIKYILLFCLIIVSCTYFGLSIIFAGEPYTLDLVNQTRVIETTEIETTEETTKLEEINKKEYLEQYRNIDVVILYFLGILVGLLLVIIVKGALD